MIELPTDQQQQPKPLKCDNDLYKQNEVEWTDDSSQAAGMWMEITGSVKQVKE